MLFLTRQVTVIHNLRPVQSPTVMAPSRSRTGDLGRRLPDTAVTDRLGALVFEL
jgi:hypothetical protein